MQRCVVVLVGLFGIWALGCAEEQKSPSMDSLGLGASPGPPDVGDPDVAAEGPGASGDANAVSEEPPMPAESEPPMGDAKRPRQAGPRVGARPIDAPDVVEAVDEPADAGAGIPALADAGVPQDATTTEEAEPSEGCSGSSSAVDETVDLANRSFILHVPAAAESGEPLPLVLNFHGYTSSPSSQRDYTEMNALADEEGFVVAYPEGLSRSFNAGSCCGNSAGSVDDVSFARDIVAHIGQRTCLDLGRVYSTGISNGGMMSFRLACEASDLVAAVAPVVGSTRLSSCEPPRGVPIISFNGTDDSLVNYAQANPNNEQWAERNGCSAGPATESYGSSSCKVWTECDDGVEVQVCTLQGMGHCWPGAPSGCPYGSANDDINANRAMWEFFSRFRKPAP